MHVEVRPTPLRLRRLDYYTKQEIPQAEWDAYMWVETTAMQDPPDVRTYVKTRKITGEFLENGR